MHSRFNSIVADYFNDILMPFECTSTDVFDIHKDMSCIMRNIFLTGVSEPYDITAHGRHVGKAVAMPLEEAFLSRK